MKNRTTLLVSFALCALVIALLTGLLGYHLGNTTPPTPSTEGKRPMITVDVDPDAAAAYFSTQELSNRVDSSIQYFGIANVCIQIGGETMKLEDAVRDNRITVDEICAYARLDATDGICRESFVTEHSLTRFIYRYDEFELIFLYDVYETPDGKQHLFKSLTICEPGGHETSSPSYMDATAKYPTRLDREDWGLTLTASGATPTQLTIDTKQSGGQHFGDLVTEGYDIYSQDTGERIVPPRGYYIPEDFEPAHTILQNGESSFTIDWANVHGELPSGSYVLKLWINDVYDASTVHPFADNFHDTQTYYIEFTIP